MTDLRKAAEMALPLLVAYQDYTGDSRIANKCGEAIEALRQALAQPEQVSIEPPDYVEPITFNYHEGWEEGFKAGVGSAKNKKESTPSNVDPRVLLISDSDFTKETGNRLCDIERRLAAIETQPDEANKKPHAVSYKDGVPVAHYNFDPPPYTAPPRKPWVSLTGEEIDDIASESGFGYINVARAIEAALKEKNNG